MIEYRFKDGDVVHFTVKGMKMSGKILHTFEYNVMYGYVIRYGNKIGQTCHVPEINVKEKLS